MHSQNYNQFAAEFLPDNHRTVEDIAWVQVALLSQMTRAEQIFFHEYMYGTSFGNYNGGTTYAIGDKVTSSREVYESVMDDNVGQDISDINYWVKILPDTVGVYERIRYDSTRLILEYALNKRYGGLFNQPPVQSEIYITKNGSTARSFFTGNTSDASAVGRTYSTGAVGNDTLTPSNTSFTINIPLGNIPTGDVEELTEYVKTIVKAHATFDINII